MKRLSTSYLTAYIILSLFALLTLLMCCVPLSLWFPTEGLDPSWIMATNQAVAQHLSFGQNFVFTCGPYAAIRTHQYNPDINFLITLTSFYFGLCFFLAFVLNLKKETFFGSVLFIIGMAFITKSPDILFFTYPLLTALSLVTLINKTQQNKISTLLALLSIVILFSPFGLLILIKGSFITICAAILILSIILCCIHRKFWFAIAAPLAAVLSTVAFWKFSGQPGSILPYFITLIQTMSGYSDAMSFNGPKLQIILFAIASLSILITILTQKKMDIYFKGFLFLCFSVFLFLSFKESFVRHDAHAITAACSLIAAISCLLLFNSIKRPMIIITLCLSVFVASRIISYYDGSIIPSLTATKNSYTTAWQNAKDRLENPNSLKEKYTAAMIQLKQQANFPIFKGTTDLYSFDQAWLFASGNTWSPRPVIQSHGAYTPRLAEMNKQHLLGNKAPNYIIFKVSPIDDRLASLEDGASWPVLLSLYAPESYQLQNDFLYLHKKDHCRFTENFSNILTNKEKLSTWVTLPTTKYPLFAKIDIEPSFWGKIASFLYKPPHLRITLLLKDGSERQHRIIAGMTQSGFVISPLIENTTDFAQLYNYPSPLLKDKTVKAIKISVGHKKRSLFWKNYYTISLNEMNVHESVHCQ